MSRNVRKYSNEYKAEAVKLALSANSVSEIAKSLGIPEATLHVWVAKAKATGKVALPSSDGNINHVNVNDVLAENDRLKKQLLRLEQEKAILKKAAAYFAKELG